MKYCFFAILTCLLLSACGPDYIYEETIEIAEPGWTYADTLDFVVDVKDTTSLYNLCLSIEHEQEFPNQNMYMRIYTKFPDGNRLTKTLSVDLMDKAGAWQGKCSSKHCKLLYYIQQGAYFNQLGEHLFTIEQYGRRDSMKSIRKIGFKVEDTGVNVAEN